MSAWLLLRGLTRESRHWGELPVRWRVAGLGDTAPLDLPGNGTACREPVPARVEDMMEIVRGKARGAGLAPPHRILAMSLGAMVATAWAQRYPDEVAALVLINTSMRPFSTAPERLRPANWPALAGMALRWHDRAHCERVIHRLTCARRDTEAADVAAWQQIANSAPVSRQAAWRQLLAAARYRAQASPPACPTLIVTSGEDRLVNPVCSDRLARNWQARHVRQVRHPWAGHDLPHDDTGWLCTAVANWLSDNGEPYGLTAPISVSAAASSRSVLPNSRAAISPFCSAP